jgi:hypothetical protein
LFAGLNVPYPSPKRYTPDIPPHPHATPLPSPALSFPTRPYKYTGASSLHRIRRSISQHPHPRLKLWPQRLLHHRHLISPSPPKLQPIGGHSIPTKSRIPLLTVSCPGLNVAPRIGTDCLPVLLELLLHSLSPKSTRPFTAVCEQSETLTAVPLSNRSPPAKPYNTSREPRRS